jgi:polygalacturonase
MYTTFPGERLPVYRGIRLKDVRSVTTGRSTVLGLDAEHPVEVSFDNETIDGLRPLVVTAAHAAVRIGPRRGNFVPAGEGVTVGRSPPATPSPAGRFEPFRPPTAPPRW